jgi:2-polyprenyl-3-methyl-5-hydroxy-6-metoxy-1,4-benzoquinol methylase
MSGSAESVASPTLWKTHHDAAELERVPCPGCGADRPTRIAEEWGLSVVSCGDCRLIYVSPRLREPEKNYWVGEDAKRQKYGAIFRGEAAHPRDRNYREHLGVLRRVKPGGRLLDVGTHCGFFLRLARGMGWELTGVEPSGTSAALAREVFQLDVRSGYLHDVGLEPHSFDVATIVDVLEHVPSPRPFLQEVHRYLAPGGVLFIKVPNARYNLLKLRILRQSLGRADFDIFDSREHVVHYTPETLTRVLRDSGFARADFYVPLPIQSGAWWKRTAREGLYWAARAQHTLTGRVGPAATDLAVLAWK